MVIEYTRALVVVGDHGDAVMMMQRKGVLGMAVMAAVR
jgi:hypothetical protein